MVVRTAATSVTAADGQEATLEFILVNHPLDCPVCDKGGECPLLRPHVPLRAVGRPDDLPEAHVRQADSRVTLIALDRERHPLLPPHAVPRRRRSPRTASSSRGTVARDRSSRPSRTSCTALVLGQRRRVSPPGRRADVDALPLRGPPVGRPERAHGVHRCAVGCNVSATIREGKVKIPVEPPGDQRGGCATRDGSRTRTSARETGSPRRSGAAPRAPRGLLGRRPRRGRGAAARGRDLRRDSALRLRDDRVSHALGRVLREGLGAHSAVLPEATSDALEAFRLLLSAIAEAELVVVVGDDLVVERAPIVDL